jgi:hypothetical protein
MYVDSIYGMDLYLYIYIILQGSPSWHMFICEAQLYGDMWHLNIVSMFISIDKLIIYRPSNKMWIWFWHVSICENQLCGDMW